MKTIAICDDDDLNLEQSAEIIRHFADETCRELTIELFNNPEDCVCNSPRFDAVFMDIEFKDGAAGIQAAAKINNAAPDCQVVYLTNYLHYSLDVYGTDHVWYVLKEQLDQRLPELFQKLDLIDSVRCSNIVINPLGTKGVISLRCCDICFVERIHRSTRIHLRDGDVFEVRTKLSDLLGKLPESSFARCHYSYAVNMKRITNLRSNELDLGEGIIVPISRNYSKQFRAKYLLWAEAWMV